MKKLIATHLILLVSAFAFGQLNCKTVTKSDGTAKTCYHKNGTISTLETWDTAKRMGNIKGFNSENKELFSHSLRSFAGHASAELLYYPNGQVSQVKYSTAPDGGIQFYKSTTKFDEQGKQTDFSEFKYPDDRLITAPQPAPPKEQPKELQQPIKQEVAVCAPVCVDYFEIQNGTTKKIKLKINTVNDYDVTKKSFEIILKPSEKIVFDTLVSARNLTKFIHNIQLDETYKKQNKEKFQVISNVTEDKERNKKTWFWVVVKK